MFNPQPKPIKKVKPKTSINRISKKQRGIKNKLMETYAIIDAKRHSRSCDAYPTKEWVDHDHTIAQQRCKHLNKTELIWDPQNIEFSSRQAHTEWENKSHACEDHKNFIKRMLFVKLHDPEMFEKRYQRLSNYEVMKALK